MRDSLSFQFNMFGIPANRLAQQRAEGYTATHYTSENTDTVIHGAEPRVYAMALRFLSQTLELRPARESDYKVARTLMTCYIRALHQKWTTNSYDYVYLKLYWNG